MVGKDVIGAAEYAGAARLEVDFAAGSLDATFSAIAEIATGKRVSDIVFAGVPIFPHVHTAVMVDLPSASGSGSTKFGGIGHKTATGLNVMGIRWPTS